MLSVAQSLKVHYNICNICNEIPRRSQTALAKAVSAGCPPRPSNILNPLPSFSFIYPAIDFIREPERFDPPIERHNKSAKQFQDVRAGAFPASRLQDPSRQGYFNLASRNVVTSMALDILIIIANTSKDK